MHQYPQAHVPGLPGGEFGGRLPPRTCSPSSSERWASSVLRYEGGDGNRPGTLVESRRSSEAGRAYPKLFRASMNMHHAAFCLDYRRVPFRSAGSLHPGDSDQDADLLDRGNNCAVMGSGVRAVRLRSAPLPRPHSHGGHGRRSRTQA